MELMCGIQPTCQTVRNNQSTRTIKKNPPCLFMIDQDTSNRECVSDFHVLSYLKERFFFLNSISFAEDPGPSRVRVKVQHLSCKLNNTFV